MSSMTVVGDRFELQEELKRGGMGIVYKAFDRERQVLAAVKMVLVADKELIAGIRREIHALTHMRHPGIVSLLGEGVHEGMPWYAMDFLDATTLLDHCRSVTASRFSDRSTLGLYDPLFDEDGETGVTQMTAVPSSRTGILGEPLAEPEVPGEIILPEDLTTILTLVRRLCAPLAYIHGEGMVHLDLKPDNVMIRASGLPVILDFGLATVIRSQLGRDAIDGLKPGAGTARYMAPEQIRGELIDARADMYSVGCILYQLLTGQVPFPGPSAAETIYGHLNLNATKPSRRVGGISEALDELVMRLLEKDPRARIGYAQDLDRALEKMGARGWDVACPSARAYVYRPRLAGRARELDTLIQGLELAQNGTGQLVLLSGESGIGKTRLVVEFAREAVNVVPTVEVLSGECRPQGGPLHGFRGILTEIAAACRALPAAEQARVLGRRAVTLARYEPAFQWFSGETERGSELLPDAARQMLFTDLLATLRALSELQPLVLILDDIQWADDLSLGFVDFLHASVDSAPLHAVVLLTHRSEEPTPYVEALTLRRDVVNIKLGRLDVEAVSTLLSDMLAMKQVSSGVVQALFLHSEGNPLFLTEYLLESVAEELVWRDADGAWHSRGSSSEELDYARLALPDNVSELIVHRLCALSGEARRLSEIAAVLGAEPDLDVMQRAMAVAEASFFDALNELQRRHVLEQKSPLLLAFAHSKIREATYGQLSGGQRAALHHLAAETLATLPEAHPARTAAAIAEHFYAANEEELALPQALIAGDEARGLYGHDAAERFYARAIATLQHRGEIELATRTLLKLGLVHMAAFAADKARAVYDEAFRSWDKLRLHNPTGLRTAELAVATGEPMSLDPGRTYDTDSAFVQRQLFACLVEVDQEANVLPAVAARWQVSADGKVYKFFLRPDARWSDGTPLTARHFEYAWKRNLSPQLASPAAALLDVLENARSYRLGAARASDVGVRANTVHELEVRLTAPIGYLLQLLAHPIAAPQPQWLVETKGPGWASPHCIVSNGAFKLVRWEHGKLVQLEHNRHDVVWSRGNVRELRCLIFHDYRDALRAYEQGDLDMLDMVQANAQLIDQLRREHADELVSVPVQSISYLVFRCDRPPFHDARVRRAFAHAIDRSQLAAAAQKIGAQSASGGFVPPGVPGHSPNLMLGHDPGLAQELLTAAGCSPSDFANVTWLHTHGIADPIILEVLTESWHKSLHIDLKPQMVRWKDYQSQLDAGVPDLIIGTWTADFSDPDNFLRTVCHGTTGLNEPKWQSAEFDLLVDNAASRTDQSGRLNFYRAADRTLCLEEAALVPLCYGREPVLVKPWVSSFPQTASWLRHLKNCMIHKAAVWSGGSN